MISVKHLLFSGFLCGDNEKFRKLQLLDNVDCLPMTNNISKEAYWSDSNGKKAVNLHLTVLLPMYLYIEIKVKYWTENNNLDNWKES